ncbi:hypothetical protein KA005_14385 [bacterium]|nr:hypothetical protein [bacterium]
MGVVYSGIPPNLALLMAQKYELRVFIETGSLVGNTAKWASPHFDAVYTIEIAYKYYIRAGMNLESFSNVQVIYGYSKDVLAGLLPQLTVPALIWLDAHWSSDLGYPRSPDTLCPVMSELKVIAKSKLRHVILIDDVRLFGVEAGWPSLDRVEGKLKSMGKETSIVTDVLAAVPHDES